MALADWQQTIDTLKEKFGQIRQTETGWDIPQDVRDAVKLAADMKDNHPRAYIFSQLDADKEIVLAREGLLQWWMPLNGRIYLGDLEGVKKIVTAMQADAGKGEKSDLTISAGWASYPFKIDDNNNIAQRQSGAVLDFLFGTGAKVEGDSGKNWQKALRESPADVISAYLQHGAPRAELSTALAELVKAQKFSQAQRIQEALGTGGFYTKVDNDTLLETKYISEPSGDSVFKTLFNFRARRVNEIYESAQRSTMTASDFSQYDTEALRYAQEMLEKLGGKPADTLDKPRARLTAARP